MGRATSIDDVVLDVLLGASVVGSLREVSYHGMSMGRRAGRDGGFILAKKEENV